MKNIFNIPSHELRLNLRAILGAFMIGTGGSDIGKLLTMMGVSDGSSFERSFNRSANFVHQKILKRCREIVESALREEINLTIEDLYEDKIDEEELSKKVEKLRMGN